MDSARFALDEARALGSSAIEALVAMVCLAQPASHESLKEIIANGDIPAVVSHA